MNAQTIAPRRADRRPNVAGVFVILALIMAAFWATLASVLLG